MTDPIDRKKVKEFAGRVRELTVPQYEAPDLSHGGPAAESEYERQERPPAVDETRQTVDAPFKFGRDTGKELGERYHSAISEDTRNRGRETVESFAAWVDPRSKPASPPPVRDAGEVSIAKAIENAKNPKRPTGHQEPEHQASVQHHAAEALHELAHPGYAVTVTHPEQEHGNNYQERNAQVALEETVPSPAPKVNSGMAQSRPAAQTVHYKGEAPAGETPEQRTQRKLQEAKKLAVRK